MKKIKQQAFDKKIEQGFLIPTPGCGGSVCLYKKDELEDFKRQIDNLALWQQIKKTEYWICQKIGKYYQDMFTNSDRLESFRKMALSINIKKSGEFDIYTNMPGYQKRVILSFSIINKETLRRKSKKKGESIEYLQNYEYHWPSLWAIDRQQGGSIENFFENIQRQHVYELLDDAIIAYLKRSN